MRREAWNIDRTGRNSDHRSFSTFTNGLTSDASVDEVQGMEKGDREAQRQVTGVRDLSWERVDRILAQSEPPSLVDFAKLLGDLGLRLSVVSEEDRMAA
jgi:hypothetical protein